MRVVSRRHCGFGNRRFGSEKINETINISYKVTHMLHSWWCLLTIFGSENFRGSFMMFGEVWEGSSRFGGRSGRFRELSGDFGAFYFLLM